MSHMVQRPARPERCRSGWGPAGSPFGPAASPRSPGGCCLPLPCPLGPLLLRRLRTISGPPAQG
eukprot:13253703-Alexandrium_andersonii.AAC.1